eukprot:SM002408S08155  [mRNA]  locus=s2408:182:1198:+ [translate_table: standard]
MAAGEGLRPSKLQRICVFCGSSRGAQPTYAAEAVELGREMARRGIGLVYGGGNVGLMGVVAGAVHEAGGQISGQAVGEVRAVANMHDRKAQMAAEADAFIALPGTPLPPPLPQAGGFGTMEELLEAITWKQLGIHDKPVSALSMATSSALSSTLRLT